MFDVLECALAGEAGRADAELLRVFRIRPVATGLCRRRGGLRGLKQQRDYQEGCGAQRAGSCRVKGIRSRRAKGVGSRRHAQASARVVWGRDESLFFLLAEHGLPRSLFARRASVWAVKPTEES